MPWFDKSIHPEFCKSEDRANQKEDRGPATPGDRIKQALTTPQSSEDAAAMREGIQSGLAHAGSVLGGGLQVARTAATIGGHVSTGVGAAAKQAAKEITSLPVVQQAAADLGREAGTRLSDAASRVANVRTTRGGLLGMNAARGIAGALPSGSTGESPESPSAASAPEVASSSEPGVLDVLLARVQSAASKPFARRRSGSLAREVVTGTQADDAAPDAAPEGDSYGTRVASVYNNAVEALTDYLLNQFKRTKREGATDLASVRAVGPMNVGRAVRDAVTGHVREAVEELGENVALSALETVVGPEEQALEDLAGFHAQYPHFLNQHEHLEVLRHSPEEAWEKGVSQYVRNPHTGRMGRIYRISDHPDQEDVGGILQGTFVPHADFENNTDSPHYHAFLGESVRTGRADDDDPSSGNAWENDSEYDPRPAQVRTPEKKSIQARYALEWLDGHPSNDWVHPDIIEGARTGKSPFGAIPRAQWDTSTRGPLGGSGKSGFEHNVGGSLYGDHLPEYDGFSRHDVPEHLDLNEETIARAAGPHGWTLPGVGHGPHDIEGYLHTPAHSPEERERYLAEVIEARKRGFLTPVPTPKQAGGEWNGYNHQDKQPLYTRSHVRLTRAQRQLLAEQKLVNLAESLKPARLEPADEPGRMDDLRELRKLERERMGKELDWEPDYTDPDFSHDDFKPGARGENSILSHGIWRGYPDWDGSEGGPYGAHDTLMANMPRVIATLADDYAAPDGMHPGQWNTLLQSEYRARGGDWVYPTEYPDLGFPVSEEDRIRAKKAIQSMEIRVRNLIPDPPNGEKKERSGYETNMDARSVVDAIRRAHESPVPLPPGTPFDSSATPRDSEIARHRKTSFALRRQSEGITDASPQLADPHHSWKRGRFHEIDHTLSGYRPEYAASIPYDRQVPYPDSEDSYGEWNESGEYGLKYDRSTNYGKWNQLGDDSFEQREKEGRRVQHALLTIRGFNPEPTGGPYSDTAVLMRAMETAHFSPTAGESTIGEESRNRAFLDGLQQGASNHERDRRYRDDPLSNPQYANYPIPGYNSGYEFLQSNKKFGVSLARHAPEILKNRAQVLRARLAEMKQLDEMGLQSRELDETGFDTVARNHTFNPEEYAKTQKDLASVQDLLQRFLSPSVQRFGQQTEEGEGTVKSFFHLTRTSALRKSMESKIRAEEKQQRRKIHREEIDEEEHGVEHEYDHGQAKHEKRVMGIVKDAEDKTIWQRMDRYTRKELDAIEKEENAQAKRIHKDHTGPGVPQFVAKYDHGIQKHKKKMKKEILELREEEKEEVKKDIAKSLRKLQKAVNAVDMSPDLLPATPMKPPVTPKLPKASAVPTTPVMKSTEPMEKSRKHKKKKSKWPSFDVQSSEIARREGVSEEDADAMLASRARNHGTKKSLTGKVDENGFVIPGTVQRRSNVGFADMDRRASEIKARADAARVLAAADAAAATPVVPSGPRIRYGDPITETIAGARGKLAAREAGGTLAGREIRVYRPSAKKKRT